MKLRPHLLAAAAVFLLTAPGLGYRHLWQDEIETAERARTILESGYPRVIDAEGRPSVSTGGREIEEGVAHRYTPWVQFYWAAAGLAPARILGVSGDAGVRLPFVAAHAATSGLVSYGLAAIAGLSPLAAAGIAVALGAQTVRVVHNRTARYHALLDLGVVMGLIGVGLLGVRRRAGLAFVAASIFFLPHVQTLAGSAFALCIGVLAAIRLVQLSGGDLRAAAGPVAAFVALPGLVSMSLLLLLTRPWAQSAWGTFGKGRLLSLNQPLFITYALCFGVAAFLLLLWKKRPRQALLVAAALGTVALTVRLLDFHPFSQPRYYLAAVFFGLLWPVYGGLDGWTGREKRVLGWALAGIILLPDLVISPAQHEGFLPFHGVRLAWSDATKPASAKQALRRAIDYIGERGVPADPVLFDYVPQFANWYLPGRPIALMPDLFAKTQLNASNPIWERTPEMPRWHIWYPTDPGGLWICVTNCDYRVSARNDAERTYVLTSKRLGVSQKMCIVQSFATERWLNAPFRIMSRAAFRPDGAGTDVLSVGMACDGGREPNALSEGPSSIQRNDQ